jgi:tetratricopeptide (TPR) repeat protein
MPNVPNIADTLAWAYYHKGAYPLAIDLLKEALKTLPKNPTYHYHLGLAYQKSGNKELAREHLKRALELSLPATAADKARQALTELGG